MMTRKDVDRQYLIAVNDKITKDIKLLVSPASFQVGIDKKPSTLKIVGETIAAGGLSVSTRNYSDGQTIDEDVTVALISGGGTITLPHSPRDGHVVIVKDATGSASSNNVVVTSFKTTVDSASSDSLTSNYQSRSYLFFSGLWYTI